MACHRQGKVLGIGKANIKQGWGYEKARAKAVQGKVKAKAKHVMYKVRKGRRQDKSEPGQCKSQGKKRAKADQEPK
jgi:hypothetical protein